MDKIRFPIGVFEPNDAPSYEERAAYIKNIPELAVKLRTVLSKLQPEQIDTPLRQKGWTIRQIVHHMADNDMNAYLRFKRALTEDNPMASSYREDL